MVLVDTSVYVVYTEAIESVSTRILISVMSVYISYKKMQVLHMKYFYVGTRIGLPGFVSSQWRVTQIMNISWNSANSC